MDRVEHIKALGWAIISFTSPPDCQVLRCVSKTWSDLVDSSRTAFYVANRTGTCTRLRTLVTKCKRLHKIDLHSIRWESRPRVLQTLSECTALKELTGVHIRCVSSARALVTLVKSQRTYLQNLVLNVYNTAPSFELIFNALPPVERLNLHVYQVPSVDYTPLAYFIRRCGHRLRELRLSVSTRFVCEETCQCNFHLVVNSLVSYSHCMQHLDVDVPCLGRVYNPPLVPLPIKSLTLRNCNMYGEWSAAFFGTALQNLKSLTLQDLKDSHFVQPLVHFVGGSCCPQLVNFACIHNWRNMTASNVEKVLCALSTSRCSLSLKEFELSWCYVGANSLSQCVSRFTALEKLSLKCTRYNTETALCDCIRGLNHLRFIDFNSACISNCQQLLSRMSQLPVLKCVRLRSNNISVTALQNFLESQKTSLVELALGGCLTTDADLYYILANMPYMEQLQILNIGGCFNTERTDCEDETYLYSIDKALERLKQLRSVCIPATKPRHVAGLVRLLRGCRLLRSVVLRVPIGDCIPSVLTTTTHLLQVGLGSCVSVTVW